VFETKVLEKIKTHFVFITFLPENRAVREILWRNVWGKYGTTRLATDDSMAHALCVLDT